MAGGAIADPPPIQNRACDFHRTRLLSTQAIVISTTATEPFRSCGLANAIVMLEVPKEVLLSLRTSRVSKALAF